MKQEKVERFSVSLPPKLLEEFDALLKEKGYDNRSEALRDLIRDFLAAQEWERGGEVIGCTALIYDHEMRGVSDRLTHLQHLFAASVLSSMHVHLDEHNCLEMLVLRGLAKNVRKAADSLIAARGVKHGKLFMVASRELE